MIFAFFAVVLLLAIRLWGAGMIMAGLPDPYGGIVVHTIGVALTVILALFIDRLIRKYYWEGYLRRKRKQDTPALIEDIVTAALLVVGASAGLYFEADMSLTGILTAGGATAIVIGIALQNVIQDLFAGLSINFDGSYVIGDWLTIYSDQFPDAKYGRVSGITWRSTYLRLEDGRRLMVPNRLVTTNPMINHSRPPGAKRLAVEILVDIRFPSERAMSILLGEAFKAVRQRGLVRTPEPSIILTKLMQDAAIYEVRFYANPDETEPGVAQSMVAESLHEAMLRHSMPAPVSQVELTQPPPSEHEFGEREVREALKGVELFSGVLNETQLTTLGDSCKPVEFPSGKTFIRQGESTASMFVILEGAARVSVTKAGGESQDVAVLGAGEMVGEMSLMTGAPRTATVTAVTPVRVIEITKEPIEALLKASPDMLERFSHVLAERQRALAELHQARPAEMESDLLSRMKKFFSRVFS